MFLYRKYKSRKFTLIELIVVIAVLGILAAIIIPNISDFQKEANTTAVISNVKNLQTSVDMYALENYGNVPSTEKPTENIPQQIDFVQIHPNKLRNLPKTEGVKYWVDFQGKVWASTIDAPTGVEFDTSNLKWIKVEDAAYYNVFKTTRSQTTGNLSKKKLIFIKKVEDTRDEVSIPMPTLQPEEEYLVNAVDKNEFESAPTGTGYTGYDNQAPVSVIGMTPDSNINSSTVVSWSYNGSIDPDGDSIISAEWQVNGNLVSNPPTTFTVGSHTVKLRVKDEADKWSVWVEKTFNVDQAPSKIDFSGGTGGSSGQYTYTAPNGVTVTSSAPVYTNSSYYYMNNLFDGYMRGDTPHDYWLTNSSGNQTLTFDFKSPKYIQEIIVAPRTRSDTYSTYRILGSNDNSNWTAITNWYGNSYDVPFGTKVEHTVNNTYRYYRFELTRNGSWGVSLAEIEFYQ